MPLMFLLEQTDPSLSLRKVHTIFMEQGRNALLLSIPRLSFHEKTLLKNLFESHRPVTLRFYTVVVKPKEVSDYGDIEG